MHDHRQVMALVRVYPPEEGQHATPTDVDGAHRAAVPEDADGREAAEVVQVEFGRRRAEQIRGGEPAGAQHDRDVMAIGAGQLREPGSRSLGVGWLSREGAAHASILARRARPTGRRRG